MLYLAWRNVTRRLGQSVVTALIVFISVFVVCTSFVVISSFENGVGLSRERLGADIMVLPAGASSDASEVLFTAQPVNVYLPQASVETVAATVGVAAATPQFFTQTVNQSCCSVVGVTRVVGIEAASDFVVAPWVKGAQGTGAQAPVDLGEDGILLGAAAPDIQGGQASILGSTFVVRGTLEETGTSVDETIFMDISAARTIAAQSPYLEAVWEKTDPATSVSCVMVKVAEGAVPEDVAQTIMTSVPGCVAVVTSEMVSGVSSQLGVVEAMCSGLLVALVLVSALALAGRFAALVSGRMRELGLMRTLGVGVGGTAGSMVCEIGIMALAGTVAGIACACVAAGAIVGGMHEAFSLPGAMPAAADYAMASGAALVFACLLVAVSLVQPVLRIVKSDPQQTLARGDL